MELLLQRVTLSQRSSIGKIIMSGHQVFTSLEPVMREVAGQDITQWKVPGYTAIPVGTYSIKMQPSARFKMDTPHLQNVPGFDAIEMHVGNFPNNTEGCILIGMAAESDYISDSTLACSKLYPLIAAAQAQSKPVTITIKNP